MNSYFPNPFLSPLQGDGQPNSGTLPCNFGGLSSRYEPQQSGGPAAGQGFLCAANQAMTGQYSSPSPNHHHMTASGAQDPSCTRTTELNGYEGQTHGHMGSTPGWGSAAGHHGQQHSPSDYPTVPPCTSENSLTGSCTGPHQGYTTSSQPIPFYPWMGVVGAYTTLFYPLVSPIRSYYRTL